MGLAELTQSSGWKKFMAKLYGWGAAVVIVGALFKIQHLPGAGIMLTTGLLIEALIFFFSAFEPLHEELDWTLVYPELAGVTDPDVLEDTKDVSKSTGALERFDDLMGGLGGIDPSVVKSLNSSFDKLNLTAASISDVSQATAATSKYVQNVSAAAESVGGLSNTFQQTAAGLQQSVGSMSNTFQQTAAGLQQSVGSLSRTFQQTEAGLQQSVSAINSSSAAMTAITDTSRGYTSQMEGINKNLAALNAVYELQLRNTNEQLQKSQGVYGGMEKMLDDVKASVDEAHRYREEMANLNRSLASLNTIYGNMLSAMNARS